jgi:hypothetical protein
MNAAVQAAANSFTFIIILLPNVLIAMAWPSDAKANVRWKIGDERQALCRLMTAERLAVECLAQVESGGF